LIILPAVYGIGTALPVVLFALLLAFSGQLLRSVFHVMSRIEWWVQRVTGVTLIVVGVYLSLKFIFGFVP